MAKWILDPGHGGRDQGVIGKAGSKESNIVLEAAIEAKRLLEKNGEEVLLTRSVDEEVDVYRRVDIANNWNGDYFVSIHMNSSLDSSISGTEVFVLNFEGKAVTLAKQVKSDLVSVFKSKDRGIKEANYTVLRETRMPAILIEGEFLSNEKVESKLDSKMYGYLIAKACLAIVDKVVLDIPPKEKELPEIRGWGICLGYFSEFNNAKTSLEELKKEGHKDACLIPYEV